MIARDFNDTIGEAFQNARQCGKSELNNEINKRPLLRYTYGDIARVMRDLEQLEEDIKNGKHTTTI